MTENTAALTASSDEAKARFTEEYMEANRIVEDEEGNLFVAIDRDGENFCACACGGELASSKRNFLPGHDQRLMGILVRGERENLEITWSDGGFRIGGSAVDYGRLVLSETGQAKLAGYLATEPKRVRRSRAAGTVSPAVQADPLPELVKIGRWTYPILDVARDANGTITKVTYKAKDGASIETVKWSQLV